MLPHLHPRPSAPAARNIRPLCRPAVARHAVGARASSSGAPGGLFGLPALRRPEDFGRLAGETVRAMQGQVERALRPGLGAAELVQALDELSDALSTALDAAELCRNVHPDPAWAAAASAAYDAVSDRVHELNSHTALYARIGALAADPLRSAALPEPARQVVASLLADAQAGGVGRPEPERRRVVELHQRASRLAAAFAAASSEPGPGFRAPLSALQRLPVHLRPALGRARRGEVLVPAEPQLLQAVLKWVPDPAVRRAAYRASTAASPAQVAALEALLDARAELAQAVGAASFAHLTLASKMVRSPEAVAALLDALAERVRPKAQAELALLAAEKRRLEGAAAGPLQPWDRAFYSGLARAAAHGLSGPDLAAYFPLDACLRGLGLLVDRLFGLRLREVPPAPGELWHESVVKWELAEAATGEVQGHVYLDLLARERKFPGAANFTIKSARLDAAGRRQLPRIALVANLAPARPQLLRHAELETLLHEFGHTLACLLCRSPYQTVSGVRCAADFVETPSTLWEHYAWDLRFVGLFARHHATGHALPPAAWAEVVAARHMFAGTELLEQVLYAAVDQALHGPRPLPAAPAQLVRTLEQRYSPLPPALDAGAEGGQLHARFAHLYNYPATYYSYLHCRLAAAEIWSRRFAPDPLSRQAGLRYQREVLAHGGARPPETVLDTILDGARPSVDTLAREIGLP